MKIVLNKYFDQGEGDPVVLIHGVENSGKFWDPISAELAKTNHVITVDLLGFGGSPKPKDNKYTLDENVEALKSTLSGIDTKVTIVGHSMGTFVALGFASKYPGMVKKIVLTSPVFIFHRRVLEYSKSAEILQYMILSRIRTFREAGNEAISRFGILYYSLAKRAARFYPSVKSVEALVEKQDTFRTLDSLCFMPITIMYGYFDPLVINSNIKLVDEFYDNIRAHRYLCAHDVPHRAKSQLIKFIRS